MSRCRCFLLILLTVIVFPMQGLAGAQKIYKVLPHFLDAQGRHSLSPSLYERDAYQAHLRQHPELQAGLRFDIQWKSKVKGTEPLILQMTLRTSKGNPAKPLILQKEVHRKGWFSQWSSLFLSQEEYAKAGSIIAWKASLMKNGVVLAEQRSFLW